LKRRFMALISALMLLTLCACEEVNTVTPWQEQYDLGIRYLSEGNYEEAIIAFTAAIKIDSKRAEAYIGLADVYLAQGDHEKAAEILDQAVAEIGETDALLDARAVTADASQAPAADTSTWQEQYDLGIRYLFEGNYEEAIIAFTAAIEIDPKQADAYVKLAETFLKLGKVDAAEEVIQKGIAATGSEALSEWFNSQLSSSINGATYGAEPLYPCNYRFARYDTFVASTGAYIADGRLFKESGSGFEALKTDDLFTTNVAVSGNWIYYETFYEANPDKRQISRYNMVTHQDESILVLDEHPEISIYREYLYYMIYLDDEHRNEVWRCDLDGENHIRVIDVCRGHISFSGDQLFFSIDNWQGDQPGIWVADLNGENKQLLVESTKEFNIFEFELTFDSLYIVIESEGNCPYQSGTLTFYYSKFYKCDLNGNNMTLLFQEGDNTQYSADINGFYPQENGDIFYTVMWGEAIEEKNGFDNTYIRKWSPNEGIFDYGLVYEYVYSGDSYASETLTYLYFGLDSKVRINKESGVIEVDYNYASGEEGLGYLSHEYWIMYGPDQRVSTIQYSLEGWAPHTYVLNYDDAGNLSGHEHYDASGELISTMLYEYGSVPMGEITVVDYPTDVNLLLALGEIPLLYH